MKKIYKLSLIIICIICLAGCSKNETKEAKQETFSHDDLIVSTEYNKINTFLNAIFNELNFDNQMKMSTSGTIDDYYLFSYRSKNYDTVFNFGFNKNEDFIYVNIIYDIDKYNSINLVKKLICYSKFSFSSNDLAEIRRIIDTPSEIDKITIGNYFVYKNSSDSLIIKIKDADNTIQNNNNLSNIENNNGNIDNSNNSNNNTNESSPNHTTSSNNQSQQSRSNQTNNTTQNSTPSTSISKQNAVKKAQSYLNYMSFSRDGLIKQLEYEKFSNEDAIYAADNVGANWNQQALKKAQSYLNYMSFSRDGLIKQLEYEGFTTDQANYGVDSVGADWNQQAVKKAQSYLNYMSFSRDGLISQLEYEGFTYEQAVYGVTQNGL